MREIKFEYIIKMISDGRIYRQATDILGIEENVMPLNLGLYTVVARRQYTGLKDKNRVEIYEGDIVKYFGDVRENGYFIELDTRFGKNVQELKSEVVFDSGYFHIKNDAIPNDRQMLWIPNSLEVIGNIYENPELLKIEK